VLAVNHVDGECFGGATVFSSAGEVLAQLPLRRPGLLFWDAPDPRR